MSFTRWNFCMTGMGIFTFLFDVGVDLWIAIKYFQQELHLYGLLTIFFIIVGAIIVQVFSYTWFKDVEKDSRKLTWILVVHLFLSGIFVRYWYALKYGYLATLSKQKTNDSTTKKKIAVEAMTDLSMLRVFKTYLESVPQLILQIYILMEHGRISIVQYASILVSVSSISWSTVDYQMCLRKSLPGTKGMNVGLPAVTYVLYKFFTLTSWIVSIVFLLSCKPYLFAILMTVLWVAGWCWTLKQKTDFCSSSEMEILYRIIIGFILIFTFFNVKGQKTKIPISIYYFVRVLTVTGILILCFYYKPNLTRTLLFTILSIATVLSLGLGIISLILYYVCFHPTLCAKEIMGDKVDGDSSEQVSRMKRFIMP
ncbi:XK-related protein 9 [Pelobates fuscus]|uniref:XK-related protein 9 n=1 Tax=Pelobates fuscus TaxID=191477 RepID=UPI002FE42C7A